MVLFDQGGVALRLLFDQWLSPIDRETLYAVTLQHRFQALAWLSYDQRAGTRRVTTSVRAAVWCFGHCGSSDAEGA